MNDVVSLQNHLWNINRRLKTHIRYTSSYRWLRMLLYISHSVYILSFAAHTNSEILGSISAGDQEYDDLGQQKCCAHSISTVEAPFPIRSGDSSYRLQVYGDDPSVHPHHRAEVFPPNNASKVDDIRWYGWSTYITKDWELDNSWVLIAQWHTQGRAVMQPLQLQVIGDKWCWVNWIGKKPDAEYNVLWCEEFTQNLGIWVDWVVHAKWSNSSDGFIHIWKNGSKIVEIRRANIYKEYAPYWKIGLVYPAHSQISRLIYVDEIRLGDEDASYKDVAPQNMD